MDNLQPEEHWVLNTRYDEAISAERVQLFHLRASPAECLSHFLTRKRVLEEKGSKVTSATVEGPKGEKIILEPLLDAVLLWDEETIKAVTDEKELKAVIAYRDAKLLFSRIVVTNTVELEDQTIESLRKPLTDSVKNFLSLGGSLAMRQAMMKIALGQVIVLH